MSVIEKVNAIVAAVCPIDGVSVGVLADKTTWRIDFASSATAQQKTAAQAAVDSFDLIAAQASASAQAARIQTDKQELQSAKLDGVIASLLDATPVQCVTWARANFPTLTQAEQNKIGMLVSMIAIAIRPQARQ